jgi:hypothetical protein
MSWVTWVFSGVGIAAPIALVSWWLTVRASGGTRVKQRIKAGNNSANIQIGQANIGAERDTAETHDKL